MSPTGLWEGDEELASSGQMPSFGTSGLVAGSSFAKLQLLAAQQSDMFKAAQQSDMFKNHCNPQLYGLLPGGGGQPRMHGEVWALV